MAEKITASWFNKIIDAIKRLKNLGFAFSTEGAPNKITIQMAQQDNFILLLTLARLIQ